MVTVVQRPTGHKVIDQAITAEIIEDYSGDAWVLFPSHGLATGATVYIVSDIDEYNGFWYVTVTNGSSFKISEGVGTDFVLFYQEADIEYYQTQEHDWNSIFLPIVYKISNDRWPVNTIDSATLIVLNADDNGFTSLTTAAPLKADVNALEFLIISDASTPEANGVWQIVEVAVSNVYVINLPFELSGNLIGATVQYYYNNYQVKVKVFAGLNALHPWSAKKPFQELAELSLTPDDNNQVMFSIADYIKMKVAIKNNLTLFSLPLNLDAFTGFYISTAESYDYSDNYSLLTNESSFVNDSFEGYAIAGKLEFKNVYAGDYADFVLTSGSPARWLTNRSRLLAVEGYYFDISFIKNIRGDFQIIIDKYVSDYLTSTETVDYEDQGIGVYRIPITPDANYDSFCVRAHSPGVSASPAMPVTTLDPLEDWTNVVPAGWTLGAAPTISVNGNGGVSGFIEGEIVTAAGYDYEFTTELEIGVTGSSTPTSAVTWYLLDSIGNAVDTASFNYTTAGIKTETFTLNSVSAGASLSVYIVNNTPFDTKNYTINSAVYNAPAAPPDDSIPAQTMTEEICIDILEACDVQDGFVTTEGIRLLEDGGYRLLE